MNIFKVKLIRVVMYYFVILSIFLYYLYKGINIYYFMVFILIFIIIDMRYVVKQIDITADSIKFYFLFGKKVINRKSIKSVSKISFRKEIRIYYKDGSYGNFIAGKLFDRRDINKIINILNKS